MKLRLLTIATSVLMLVYGVARWFDGRDGEYGPSTAWNIGHVAFFVAFVGYGALTVLPADCCAAAPRHRHRRRGGTHPLPVLVLAALVVVGANLDLMPLVAALLGVGLVPVGWRMTGTERLAVIVTPTAAVGVALAALGMVLTPGRTLCISAPARSVRADERDWSRSPAWPPVSASTWWR